MGHARRWTRTTSAEGWASVLQPQARHQKQPPPGTGPDQLESLFVCPTPGEGVDRRRTDPRSGQGGSREVQERVTQADVHGQHPGQRATAPGSPGGSPCTPLDGLHDRMLEKVKETRDGWTRPRAEDWAKTGPLWALHWAWTVRCFLGSAAVQAGPQQLGTGITG